VLINARKGGINSNINYPLRALLGIIRSTPDNKSFTGMLAHFNLKPEAVLNTYVRCKETGEQKHLMIASYNLEDWKGRFELYRMDVKSL
jgi:hypothetical protein